MIEKKPAVLLSKRTPHLSAVKFNNLVHPNLIRWNGDWFDWHYSGAFKYIDDGDMRAKEAAWLIEAKVPKDGEIPRNLPQGFPVVPFDPKNADIAELDAALARRCHKSAESFSPPCWLDSTSKSRPKARNVVVCRNGMVDIDNSAIFSPLSPNFFTFTALPVDYDPNANEPKRFLKFLDEVSGGRRDFIDGIQMLLGLLLTADTSYQVIAQFLGVPRGGKGTLIRVIEALIGKYNIANPSIHSIAAQFGLMGLQTKTLAIFSDYDNHDKQRLLAAGNLFNKLSGEDTVRIDRKHKEPIDIRLLLRLLVAGNKLPDFGEYAPAISHRLRIWDFNVSFAGREDFQLEEKLLAELTGILNFAIRGRLMLREAKRFPETTASAAIKLNMLRLSNAVRAFVLDECALDADASTNKDTLYRHYELYCRASGVRFVKSKDEFGLELLSLYPEQIRQYRPKIDGKRYQHYAGIKLIDDPMTEPSRAQMRQRWAAMSAAEQEAMIP